MRSFVVVLLLFSSGALGELQCWEGLCFPGYSEYPQGCPTDPSSFLNKENCTRAAVNGSEALCWSSVGYRNSSIEWNFGCDPLPEKMQTAGCFEIADADMGYYTEVCFCDTPLCNNAPHMNLTTPSPTTKPETTAQPELGELQCWEGACFPPMNCPPDPSPSLTKTTCSYAALNGTIFCGNMTGHVNSSLVWAYGCDTDNIWQEDVLETGCFDVADIEEGAFGTLCFCDTPLCNAPDSMTQPSASARPTASSLASLFAVGLFILPSIVI